MHCDLIAVTDASCFVAVVGFCRYSFRFACVCLFFLSQTRELAEATRVYRLQTSAGPDASCLIVDLEISSCMMAII